VVLIYLVLELKLSQLYAVQCKGLSRGLWRWSSNVGGLG